MNNPERDFSSRKEEESTPEGKAYKTLVNAEVELATVAALLDKVNTNATNRKYISEARQAVASLMNRLQGK
jgi:hypothetical protein